MLFLGHPTYALTVVIFLLMLSSGAGSLMSRRWILHTELAWIPLLLAIGILSADAFFLPHVLAEWVGLKFADRLAISAILLIPLGFVMGMPFPTGLRALTATPSTPRDHGPGKDSAVEWAWAMNAAASVLGSVMAMLIAIEFGLTATLACGAVAYIFALLLLPVLRAQPS